MSSNFEISTDLANFLAKAYRVPVHLLAKIFERTETAAERNLSIVALCFEYYLLTQDIDQSKDFTTQLEAHYTPFLAAAVVLTYMSR
jgi:hypothetical protein